LGISPFPGQEIGLFTCRYKVTLEPTMVAVLFASNDFPHGPLSTLIVKHEKAEYYVVGETYDLGSITP
jgi:hypothetical protein